MPHGLERAAHDVAEQIFEDRVDDGVLELRVLKPVAAAGLGEVVEADRQREFARLKLLAPQLAHEPRRLAERERERGFVIRFVVGQGGGAGNRGAILHLQQQRLVPLAVGEEPELLAPDAELLLEQHGLHLRHVAERACAETGQRTLAALRDAGEFAQRAVAEKFFFIAGFDFEEAGFAHVGGELGEARGTGEAAGDGQAQFLFDAVADGIDVIGGRGVAPDVRLHRGEIHEALVNRGGHQRGRIFLDDAEHFLRQIAVGIVARLREHAEGAAVLRLEARHAGLDAELLCLPVRRDHDAVPAPPAADPDGPAFPLGMQGDLAACEEAVAVEVEDAIRGHGENRRLRGWAWMGQISRMGRLERARDFNWLFLVHGPLRNVVPRFRPTSNKVGKSYSQEPYLSVRLR